MRTTGLTKHVAAWLLLCLPAGAFAQHVPDLSPHAIGSMPDVMIDELLAACGDQKPPDWLTWDECERLSNERERRFHVQNGSRPRPQ